jgi:hypothetical protein
MSQTATLLNNGFVLMTGGRATGLSDLADAELYNPKTGAFAPTGTMGTARSGSTATLLKDGRVLVAGGSLSGSAEIYDPRKGSFTPAGFMTTSRVGQTATLLKDGRVLIAGGTGGYGSSAQAELYAP